MPKNLVLIDIISPNSPISFLLSPTLVSYNTIADRDTPTNTGVDPLGFLMSHIPMLPPLLMLGPGLLTWHPRALWGSQQSGRQGVVVTVQHQLTVGPNSREIQHLFPWCWPEALKLCPFFIWWRSPAPRLPSPCICIFLSSAREPISCGLYPGTQLPQVVSPKSGAPGLVVYVRQFICSSIIHKEWTLLRLAIHR